VQIHREFGVDARSQVIRILERDVLAIQSVVGVPVRPACQDDCCGSPET
jgi:hypothetical protein